MRPVEIVGGGLAGLGLGIALRAHGVPVTIREAGRYPRHRVCGEFITSLDRTTRETLQLNAVLARARPARGVAWCEDKKDAITHQLSQPALCVSRHVLDQEMAATFLRLGGELRTGARGECEDKPGRVLACGRRPRSSSRWVGVKQHFRHLELRNDLEVHFGRRGYIGLTRIDRETVNVCGLLPRGSCDLHGSFTAMAGQAGFVDLSERLAGAEPVAGSFCAVAGLDYNDTAPDDSFRVGDRGALIPPFTGHGMTIALQSATIALDPLLAWARGEIGWAQAKAAANRRQRRRFGWRIRTARTLHPILLDARARGFARALHRRSLLPVGLLYRVMH
jgi:flavin-dependent dehydrogenase